jgi:hypothetical protein
MSIVDCRVSIIDFSRVDSRFSRVASRVAFRNDVSSQDSSLMRLVGKVLYVIFLGSALSEV